MCGGDSNAIVQWRLKCAADAEAAARRRRAAADDLKVADVDTAAGLSRLTARQDVTAASDITSLLRRCVFAPVCLTVCPSVGNVIIPKLMVIVRGIFLRKVEIGSQKNRLFFCSDLYSHLDSRIFLVFVICEICHFTG